MPLGSCRGLLKGSAFTRCCTPPLFADARGTSCRLLCTPSAASTHPPSQAPERQATVEVACALEGLVHCMQASLAQAASEQAAGGGAAACEAERHQLYADCALAAVQFLLAAQVGCDAERLGWIWLVRRALGWQCRGAGPACQHAINKPAINKLSIIAPHFCTLFAGEGRPRCAGRIGGRIWPHTAGQVGPACGCDGARGVRLHPAA